MVDKYHISSGAKTAGQLVVCRAEKKGCPKGGEAAHRWFDSPEEAAEYSELRLAVKMEENPSTRQLERLLELQEKSDALNPKNESRENFGSTPLDTSFRFLSNPTQKEVEEATAFIRDRFTQGKLTGKGIREGRIEVKIDDRYGHRYGTPIIAEDFVNGGYILGKQVYGEFYSRRHSSDLSKIVEVAANDYGYAPGEEVFEED